MPILRQTLGELRRYHRLLMAGGRWAAALVLLVALIADIAMLVRTYVTDERQTFEIAHRLVRGRVDGNVHSFLNGLVRAELSWGDERAVPLSLIARFKANNNLLYWKPFPDERLELVLAAAPGATPDDATIEHYFQFATQIGRANIAASRVLERQTTQIFFSPDRKIVALLPSSAVDHPERLALDAGRADFVRELTDGSEELLPGVPTRLHNVVPKVHWSPHLYTLPNGSKVLRLAAPVVHHDRIEAILVNEVDPSDLIWPIAGNLYEGTYAIVTDAGDVIATTANGGLDGELANRISRWQQSRERAAGKRVEQRDGSRVFLARKIGQTGYTLVYTYSWRDIAAAIWGKALTAAAISVFVLVAIWFMLYVLNRRVFRPMYARSAQVFESERLSRTMIETVPVGIGLVSTGSGELLYGGSSLLTLGEMLEGGMQRLLGELSKCYARRQLADRNVADAVFREDLILPTRDGSQIALQAHFAFGRYLGKDVLVTAFIDMTASRQLQQQLHDAKLAADQANAAKSSFLATMSHEIRTPLNAILGNLELLAHSSLNPLQRDRLHVISMSSRGLLAIIQDVLDFSKIEAGEMQLEHISFNVADVMVRALTIFAPIAQAKGIVLYGAFGSAIDQRMRGDPGRLAQVVHNLLSNAIKFTLHGKVTLRIAYAASPADSPLCSKLVVTVSDTGIGIDEAQREHLFKAFAQADSSISRRFGGTGLGLALCQRLTATMGGTIRYDGELGQGSCFTVSVPLDCANPSGQHIVPDPRIFAGQSVVLMATSDDWHAYAVPLMTAWGAHVKAVHHPDEIADIEGRVLVICGDRKGWSADSENRLVEDCSAVINCSINGPLQPIRVGRVLSVSCFSPSGLRNALAHVLNGEPLIPLNAPPAIDDDSSIDTQPTPRLDLHVLVAEDNEVNQRLLDEQLTLLGCSARIVGDGVEALQVLSEETFDVLLTDLNMPRMDGYLLAQIMRERWPHTPIVAITADATVNEHRRCSELGIRAVVSKPLSLGRLAKILTQVSNTDASPSGPVNDDDGPVGDRTLPASVVAAFRQSCNRSLDMLRDALSRGDEPTMLAELHSLKGALGIFQQRELARRCSELERQIHTHGLGGVGSGIQTLIDALGLLSDHEGS
ncbi:response regulator [Burkholderia cenocepacia]|uniref:Virulence sensor protein BvgS n=1 Tax=Burkholderia cenocepacia TaxID=95486 RepID=A0AAN0RXH4_9BURK|nr:response regulator [Burkholderia cenocepacia]